MKKFKTGDYIVLTSCYTGNDCWKHSLPMNYCYKLSRNPNLPNDFIVEKDAQNVKDNGWTRADRDTKSKVSYRHATLEESIEYDRLDKPFDVTTLIDTKPEDMSYLIDVFKKLNIS